jgi:hypothetical protein
MGTRCRGLGEILARLTGPFGGQIVTRFQITERKSIIAQIVEIGVVGELERTFPQGLKPHSFEAMYGTTEVVPFQSTFESRPSRQIQPVHNQNERECAP